jgi:hypothetical protein
MEHYTQLTQLIALTMGVAWASGINLYATLLSLGFMSQMGYIELPVELAVLSDPLVIMASGLMYMVEFVADKTPGVDSSWDAVHTFIRIPAGALLAAGMVSEVGLAAELAAAIVGATITSGAHLTKASSRLIINTSPEPVSNWTASFAEDIAVFAGLWAALNHPILFLILLITFIIFVVYMLPRLFRTIKTLFRKVSSLFSSRKSAAIDKQDIHL